MEDSRSLDISQKNPETQILGSCNSRSWEGREGDDGVSSDSMLCIPGSRLVPAGFKQMNCTGPFVFFCLFFCLCCVGDGVFRSRIFMLFEVRFWLVQCSMYRIELNWVTQILTFGVLIRRNFFLEAYFFNLYIWNLGFFRYWVSYLLGLRFFICLKRINVKKGLFIFF